MKYGRRAPKGAPAIRLADVLTGTVPEHPAMADYLTRITGWEMLGNDTHGDCVAVALANVRKIITAELGDKPYEPTLDQVLAFYRTQNPGFPSEDNGMDEQTALETLLKSGDQYYDGVKPLAFAKVNVADPAELDAAVAIFGPTLLGIQVRQVNMAEFDAGQPWDYLASSRVDGGHAVVEGGYDESTKTGLFETWARVTRYTDAFRQHQLEEAWVIIWPEHLGTKAFLEGVDQAALATAYTALTGRPFPVQPTPPAPTPEPPAPTPEPPAPPAPTPGPVSTADVRFARHVERWAYRVLEYGSPTPDDVRLVRAAIRWFRAIGFDGVAHPALDLHALVPDDVDDAPVAAADGNCDDEALD